ncbi:hypothetical protein V5O48_008101 [Marasmius crinis-equi]|uniref:Xylosidase/arabinosidase n=1 Tax=Marasmius crinis-equi TaxID=585013 RepID=A0ABR3FF63_9AGAR
MSSGGRPTVDLWPDVSDYSTSELYPAPGLKHKNGDQAMLYSSRHPQTVQRHFHWMARHGIDGAFLQRFAGQCDTENGSQGLRRLRDEIGDRVKDAAEKEGRVFAIMYDVSGVPPERVARILETDWLHLSRDKQILDSPNYLKEKGKPVVALWGFGFDGRKHTPGLVRQVVETIRRITPGGAYVMAGTPTHWRTATEDADRNPDFLDVWLNDFDAISPWMVGRLRNNDDVERFAEYTMKPDIELLRKRHEEGKRKVDYIPVIYPGFSGLNLSEGRWGFNDIKREGGRFFWKQIFSVKRLGVRSIYGAMWDEYDEGTALIPVVEKARLLPDGGKYPFLALDADGYDIPADWYMKICGFAAEGLRSERMIHETFPSKELQDYWSSRPRYEEQSVDEDKVEGSSRQAYEDWLGAQKDSKDEAPPPPYSLEAEEVPVASTSAQPQGSSTAASAPSVPAEFAPTPLPAAISSVIASHQSSAPPSHSNIPEPQSQEPQVPNSDVTSLANDLARQAISSSPSPAPPQSPAILGSSPVPPLHPSHPSVGAGSSAASPSSRPPLSPPPSHPSSRPRPNLASRPSTRPHPPEETRPPSQLANRPEASPGLPQGPQFPSPQTQPQTQWPPAEWGINRPPTSQAPYRPYSRPSPSPQPPQQDYVAPGHGLGDSRPPSAPIPTPPHSAATPQFGPTGPYPDQSYQQESAYTPQSSVSFPQADINPVPVGTSSHNPAMNSYSSSTPSPTFPSNVPSQTHYPFPTGPSSQPQDPYSTYSQSSYNTHGPYTGSPLPSQPYSQHALQGPQTYSPYGPAQQSFPQPDAPGLGGSGGGSYYSGPSYPPPNNSGGYRPSYTQATPPTSTPSPNNLGGGPGPGPWTPPPEGYQQSAPRPSPRPIGTPVQNHSSATPGPYNNSNASYSSSSSSSGSSSFAGSSSFGYAMNAVQKVAGRNTRDQLESLAQTGGKFFGKFK